MIKNLSTILNTVNVNSLANTALTTAQGAFTQANSAYALANSTFTQYNSSYAIIIALG